MLNKNSQRGFSAGVVVLVLLVIGVIGAVGYVVLHKRSDKNAVSTSGTTSTSAEKSEPAKSVAESWQAGAAAVRGAYADANVVKVNDTTWRMYYATQPGPSTDPNSMGVHSSTSTDGKTWKQDAGMRLTGAAFPEVIKLPDGKWRMYYQQAGTIKSATSSDGLVFTEEPGVRIDATASEKPAVENAAAPTVLRKDDGTYVMMYRVTVAGVGRYADNAPNPTTQISMWATSSDGLTFAKKGIAIDSRDKTLNGQIDGMEFVKWDDGKIRVYFTTYAGVYESVFDGSKFGEPALAFAGDAQLIQGNYTGAPPGDPTLVKIGDTWYMYYGGGPEEPGIHYATYKP